MFILNKKNFLKTIRQPLQITVTDKNNRFTGLSEEKLKETLENPEEWAKLTRTRGGRDKYCGVIPYLTDVILNKPEQIFDDYRSRGELDEIKRDIVRKLAHFLRVENFEFSLENRVCFEEKLQERQARTGLSQLLESSELEEPEINEEREARSGLTQILQESDLIGSDAHDAHEHSSMLDDPKNDAVMGENEYFDVLVDNGEKDVEVAAADVAVAEVDNDFEREAEDDESILDMFLMNGTLPANPKGGPRSTWNTKFIELATNLISGGETAASTRNFFATTASFYPELLGDNKRVPGVQWFEKLRDAIPHLNAQHTKDVVLNSDRLFLASDAAAMADTSKCMAVGIINQQGKLHLLDVQKAQGETGDQIAEQMLSIIDDTGVGRILQNKIECLMTDQSAAQVRANMAVVEKLTRGDDNEPATLFCAMHTTSNSCKNAKEALKEVSPESFCLLDDIKSVYGKPPKSGYCQQDGRSELRLLLKELDDTKTRIFSHDLGKRFGCDERNSGALILHFKTVLKVTKLKKFQFDQKKGRNEESKFHRIERLCSGQNNGYLLDSAVLFLNYAAFLNFFHKKISRVGEDALTLSQLKNLFKSTLLRMQTTLDSDEPYAALIDSARLMSESAISSSTVDEIDSRWCRATAVARRKRLNAVLFL